MRTVLERIDGLKQELDALRPLPKDADARVAQKLRIESSYHSNALEGNSLTLGETRSLILHGLTARGKPMRDHLDIEGHDGAVRAVDDAVAGGQGLTEAFVRGLHAILLKEPYAVDAETPDGRPVPRRIEIGAYKGAPNNVRTSTGDLRCFAPPEQVKPAMTDLLDWYRARAAAGEHPVVLAAAFHYRFVRIHPFDDGNGRMARLLMNMILIRHGYPVAIVRREERGRYIEELEGADRAEDLSRFIEYVASCCEYALRLHLRAARGEPIEDPDDVDREIARFKQSLVGSAGDGGQVPARRYVERVVVPFRDYCLGKVHLFRENFASIADDVWTLDCRSADHKVFSIPTHGNDVVSNIPEAALEIATRFCFDLNSFQNSGTNVSVDIRNGLSSLECTWIFHLNDEEVESYNGQDLAELQLRFNSLLRSMMVDLRHRGPLE